MPKAPEHPNLLFIMTDDMGAWAMHCAGNSEIHTPNLDRLAAMGMRMENLFCVSPVCSPAPATTRGWWRRGGAWRNTGRWRTRCRW